MKNKKMAAVGMSAAMLLGAVPVNAVAEGIVINDVNYNIDEENNAHVKSYNGKAASVVIPESINGYSVKYIDNGAVYSISEIEKVTLPSGIKTIGSGAFMDNRNMKSINFPSSLESIGAHAFSTDHSLINIKLNNGLKKISECSFQLCISAETMTVPSTVETVPDHAFHGMYGLKTLRFLDGVKKIDKTAALNTTEIRKIIIPPSVKEINEYAVGYRYYSPNYKVCGSAEIYGKSGSEAEKYANANGIPFVEFDFMYGDMNSDGKVDAVDASTILSVYAKRSSGESISGFSKSDDVKADVNDDLVVDSVDASMVLSYYSYASSSGKKSAEEYFFLA